MTRVPVRLVVGMCAGAAAADVVSGLLALGATSVDGPLTMLPDTLLVGFADDATDSLVDQVRALTGVRYAEAEQPRYGTDL